jgi:hypothetical protein
MFPIETSSLWRFLEAVERWYPGLLLQFLLLGVVAGAIFWMILLGGFRLRGHHPYGSNRKFRPAPGVMSPSVSRFRRSLSRRLLQGPPLLGGSLDSLGLGVRLRRLLLRFHALMLSGPSFSLQLLLLFLLTAYTFALALSLLLVHWQEFSLVLEAHRYVHWDWTASLSRRGDLEYRWWLKWFWRHSVFGTGYFRGVVRLGRGGPGPRPHLKWKRPRRNLLYWLGVVRHRRPHRPFRDWVLRARTRLRHRYAQRWLRYLLGLCTGLLFLQSYALIMYFRDLPVLVRRASKRFPRPGSPAGRRFGIERDTRLDVVRKANLAGVILVLLVVFLVWGWGGLVFPPGTNCRPLLGVGFIDNNSVVKFFSPL